MAYATHSRDSLGTSCMHVMQNDLSIIIMRHGVVCEGCLRLVAGYVNPADDT